MTNKRPSGHLHIEYAGGRVLDVKWTGRDRVVITAEEDRPADPLAISRTPRGLYELHIYRANGRVRRITWGPLDHGFLKYDPV